jgi:hypothetical protein
VQPDATELVGVPHCGDPLRSRGGSEARSQSPTGGRSLSTEDSTPNSDRRPRLLMEPTKSGAHWNADRRFN